MDIQSEWERSSVAPRRAVRQGGRSPTERSQQCWLAGARQAG